MRFGKISPRSTQTSGPQVAPKQMTNRLAATSATGPQMPGSDGLPFTCTDWAKASAITPSDTNIPIDPLSSSGRLPAFSTKKIATNVTATLTTEVTTEMVNDVPGLVVSKPTLAHNDVE